MRLSLGVWMLAVQAASFAAAPLPALKIERSEVTVSGLSSGGFMAVQLHVAYSGTFTKGVGAIAGGPFYCAENSTVHALSRCMKWPAGIPTQKLIAATQAWADQGLIDSTQHLARSRVYLFSGTQDGTVKPGVVGELARYYAHWVAAPQRVYQQNIAAGHGIVTDGTGNACPSSASPFINDCGFDLVGHMFSHLYGSMQPKALVARAGSLREFDQKPFAAHGLASTGWIYVPEACTAGVTACRMHVALHGCRQNSGYVTDRFVVDAGYNRWAESNRVVVLYPQTGADAPNGCWDWWGYSGDAYATREGPQMKAVKGMVDRLLGQ